MNFATISLKGLFNKFNGELKSGTIKKSAGDNGEYYDLYVNKQLVCMDGETCEVIEEIAGNFVLLNDNGEKDVTFILTNEEMEIGAYSQ